MKARTAALLLQFLCITLLSAIPFSAYAEEATETRGRRIERPAPDETVRAARRAHFRSVAAAKLAENQGALGVLVKPVHGVQVMRVMPGSPAEQAGIQPGDIILNVNKIAVNTGEQLKSVIAGSDKSTPLLLNISRNNLPISISAKLNGQTRIAAASPPARPLNDGINPAQTSDDPSYAYTKENPVKLGSNSDQLRMAVSNSYVYLKQLRDKNRQPFRYQRVGNVGPGPDGHITDHYKLTDSEGNEHNIYIDMYHPENNPLDCKAPKGMFIAQ